MRALRFWTRPLASLLLPLLTAGYSFSQQPPLPTLEAEGITDKRLEWFRHQREYPGTFIPPLGRMQALASRIQAEASRSIQANSATWTSIGPQPIASQASAYAGRVNDIAVDPRNASVAYAGTD